MRRPTHSAPKTSTLQTFGRISLWKITLLNTEPAAAVTKYIIAIDYPNHRSEFYFSAHLYSASEMTFIVSGGALNSTHSLPTSTPPGVTVP